MSKAARQVGTRTQASEVHAARQIVACGENYGLPVAVGKLWYSKLRYSWIFRFDERTEPHEVDGGCTFEPVQIIPA